MENIKLILSAIFIVINIVLAYIDSNRIKQGKRIYHGINGLLYGGLTACTYFLTYSIPSVFALLFLRIPVFNSALNLFRGLPINYTSKTTTSIIDRLTYGIIERVGYFNYCFIMFWIVVTLFCI